MAGPLILSFDTSGPHCAAALLSNERVLASRYEPMAKGQAERLMPMVQDVLADDGITLDLIDAIAVGVGPGNFTGIRIAVSAARGLALALGVPAVGVTSFEAMRGANSPAAMAPQLVSLPGPRGGLYLQRFEGGVESRPPQYLADPHQVDWAALGVDPQTEILGEASDVLNALRPPDQAKAPPAVPATLSQSDLAATIGRIAVQKLARGTDLPRPAPLYVRPPDAAPARDTGPVLLP